jgi:hypothetical protein
MDEEFDFYREVEQGLVRLMAVISPERYERLGPGLQELGLAIAERREALREVDRTRGLQERLEEDYNRVLEGYNRANEDLERAKERTKNALRLLKDAL